MICLFRHSDESGTTPLLVYAGIGGFVWCEQRIFLRGACLVDGVVITEPVNFPTTAAALLLGTLMRGKTVVRQLDDIRDGKGKLVDLVRSASTNDMPPTPRTQLVKDMTPLQKAKFIADVTAAVAAKLP